ncbi:phospholipase A [Hydrogenimonas sp. SS33]|uniref:phospholipase A n=1 Tax=Hydrogenimonas leucolamina TaxID=2954236 RepID=UPI00336C2BBF
MQRQIGSLFGSGALALLLLASPAAVLASSSDSQLHKAIGLFEAKHYKEALPLLEELAESGDKTAMYRLAYMYENGLGVPKDFKAAALWYKKAASTYAYAVESQKRELDINSDSFATRFKAQFTPESMAAARENSLAKIGHDTPETKTFFEEFAEGRFFGLMPYKANYILPIGYADQKYRRQPSAYKNFAIADAINPIPGFSRDKKYGYYDEKAEVEFQFSLKKNLTYNLFGFHEYITAAYTQRSFWQLYSASGPFRETNYMPELFATFPTSSEIDNTYGLKATKWGFIHQSNGQEGYRSRSWNRLYLAGLFQWGNLFLKPRVWYRIPETDKSDDYYRGYVDVNHNGRPDTGDRLVDPNSESGKDDNPDITDYLGYGDITFSYLWHKHQFGGLFRYNFGKGGHDRGAVQLDWSYPFFGSKTTFWYFKLFNGYGESLIDYNHNVTKTSFGFAFSRGIFQ